MFRNSSITVLIKFLFDKLSGKLRSNIHWTDPQEYGIISGTGPTKRTEIWKTKKIRTENHPGQHPGSLEPKIPKIRTFYARVDGKAQAGCLNPQLLKHFCIM